jgi:single-stranded-DNA-specific exonuclease
MRDSKEFSTLLNACGRHGEVNIGLDTMMKVPGAYEQAKGLLELHQRMLREGIEYAQKKVIDLGTFYLLDARGVIEDTLVGVVAGMLYSSIPPTKPIIALSIDKENNNIKISGRATGELVRNGVDLGKSLGKVCEGIGKGGGHNIAAGATIEPEHVNLFIKRIGEEF